MKLREYEFLRDELMSYIPLNTLRLVDGTEYINMEGEDVVIGELLPGLKESTKKIHLRELIENPKNLNRLLNSLMSFALPNMYNSDKQVHMKAGKNSRYYHYVPCSAVQTAILSFAIASVERNAVVEEIEPKILLLDDDYMPVSVILLMSFFTLFEQ